MREIVVTSLAVAAMSVSCAKIVVTPLPTGSTKLNAEGVFYALPKTVARVQIKVDKEECAAAPYSLFAPIFAPGRKVVCGPDKPKADETKPDAAKEPDDCPLDLKDPEYPKQKVAYSIQQGATFTTFGEPDPAQMYLVRFTGGGAIDQALVMTWTESGVLSTASASVTNRSVDIAMSGLKLATSLGAKFAYGGGSIPLQVEKTGMCPEIAATNDSWVIPMLKREGGNAKDALIANYCNLPTEKRSCERWLNKSRHSKLLARATRAYEQLYPSVEALDNLQMGKVNIADPVPTATKLEAAIDKQLKTLYLGTTKTITWEPSFDLRDLSPGLVEVLRLDAEQGPCFHDGLLAPDAKHVPEGFGPHDDATCKAKTATPINVEIAYYPAEKNQLFHGVKTNTEAPAGDRGFRYRIPAQVRATLKDAKDTYGTGVFSVAQLGITRSLPAKRHSRTISYELALIEATGGLKSFKLGTTGGLDAATIDAISAAGGTVIDARNTGRKAAATQEDEVTTLTRQQTILKLNDEICELQKKHGLPCALEP